MKKKPTKKRFNWRTRLNQIVQSNIKNPRDYARLFKRAGRWPTCACGTLCRALPRDHNKSPLDYDLRKLGFRFSYAISRKNWKAALRTFHQIEARTDQLLKAA